MKKKNVMKIKIILPNIEGMWGGGGLITKQWKVM